MSKLLVVFCMLFIGFSAIATEKHELPVMDLSGEVVNIGDKIGKGKWVLVMFWATDCAICKMQEPTISSFHEARSEIDAEVIGISIDGPDKMDEVKQYLKENKLSYPNYVSDVISVSFNYNAITQSQFRGTPTYMLFNPEGKLLGDNPGPIGLEALENFIDSRS